MSKKNIRILALGFFVSGLLLTALDLLFSGNQASDSQAEVVESLETEIKYLEEKVAEFEIAQEPVVQAEAAEESINEDSVEEGQTEVGETDAAETETNESVEPEAKPVITTTVTIGEGEPSSVAARQLEAENIVEDRFEFDGFLESQGYAPLVRPGSYEITSEMSYEQMAQKLMGR